MGAWAMVLGSWASEGLTGVCVSVELLLDSDLAASGRFEGFFGQFFGHGQMPSVRFRFAEITRRGVLFSKSVKPEALNPNRAHFASSSQNREPGMETSGAFRRPLTGRGRSLAQRRSSQLRWTPERYSYIRQPSRATTLFLFA